jgi:Iron-containing redox enzyme
MNATGSTGTTSSPDIVDLLDALLDETEARLTADPRYGRFIAGTATREEYLELLARTYHYVKQTRGQLVGGAKALGGRTDPISVALRESFEHHAKEETGHDAWVLDDIRALGGDAGAVAKGEPCLAVKIYTAVGEIVLASKNPLGIMGVGFVLEGLAEKIAVKISKNMIARSGIPNIEKATTFFSSHGEADIDHMAEGRATLRTIPEDGDRAAILLAARLTAVNYCQILWP